MPETDKHDRCTETTARIWTEFLESAVNVLGPVELAARMQHTIYDHEIMGLLIPLYLRMGWPANHRLPNGDQLPLRLRDNELYTMVYGLDHVADEIYHGPLQRLRASIRITVTNVDPPEGPGYRLLHLPRNSLNIAQLEAPRDKAMVALEDYRAAVDTDPGKHPELRRILMETVAVLSTGVLPMLAEMPAPRVNRAAPSRARLVARLYSAAGDSVPAGEAAREVMADNPNHPNPTALLGQLVNDVNADFGRVCKGDPLIRVTGDAQDRQYSLAQDRQTDAGEFAELLSESQWRQQTGELETAVDLVERALGLWRGLPFELLELDDFGREMNRIPAVQAEVVRLLCERERSEVQRMRCQHLLGSPGRATVGDYFYARLVPQNENGDFVPVEGIPRSEKLARAVMLSRWWCEDIAGAQLVAEALPEWEPATDDLMRQINACRLPDGWLPLNPAPGLPPRVFGMKNQIEKLVDERRPRLVIVTGPKGVGKSTLLRSVAARTWHRQTTLFGRCGAESWSALCDVLRGFAAHADVGFPKMTPGTRMAQSMPEFFGRGSESTDESFTRREELWQAVVAEFSRMTAPLLLLDDLDRLDDDSAELLDHLLAQPELSDLTVIATATREPAAESRAAQLLDSWDKAQQLQRSRIEALDPSDAEELYRATHPDHAEPPRDLAHFTAGLPRLVVAYGEDPEGLDRHERTLLRVAAMLGDRFRSSEVELVAQTDFTLKRFGGLVEGAFFLRTDERDIFEWLDPELRQVVLDGMTPEERQQLHRDALDRRKRATPEELARHADEAGLTDDRELLDYYWEAASWLASNRSAFAGARRWFLAAQRILDEGLDRGFPCLDNEEILRFFKSFSSAMSHYDELTATTVLRKAFRLAAEQGLTATFASAVADLADARIVRDITADPQIERVLRMALSVAGLDPAVEARLHARLAMELLSQPPPADTEAAEHANRAMELAEATTDRQVEVRALRAAVAVSEYGAVAAQHRELLKLLRTRAVETGEQQLELIALLGMSSLEVRCGDFGGATELLEEAEALAEALLLPRWQFNVFLAKAELQAHQGASRESSSSDVPWDLAAQISPPEVAFLQAARVLSDAVRTGDWSDAAASVAPLAAAGSPAARIALGASRLATLAHHEDAFDEVTAEVDAHVAAIEDAAGPGLANLPRDTMFGGALAVLCAAAELSGRESPAFTAALQELATDGAFASPRAVLVGGAGIAIFGNKQRWIGDDPDQLFIQEEPADEL